MASNSWQSLVLWVSLNFSHLYKCVALFHFFFMFMKTNDMEYFFLVLTFGLCIFFGDVLV